jgi:hypothetical protein
MPISPSTVLRPGSIAGFSAGYLGGFDVFASAGPLDGVSVTTLWAQARPSAYLLGAGWLAMTGRVNAYFGSGKAATIFSTLGFSGTLAAGAAGEGPGVPLVVINSDFVSYPVLPADLVTEAATLLALFTNGTNTNKGGNP